MRDIQQLRGILAVDVSELNRTNCNVRLSASFSASPPLPIASLANSHAYMLQRVAEMSS